MFRRTTFELQIKGLGLTAQTTCSVGKMNILSTGFKQRWLMDLGVVDIARCMGRETRTIHLNFQVGLKAHLEERAFEKS